MSTVMEDAPVVKWEMPKAYCGQIVLWYERGAYSGPAPVRCVVDQIWSNGLKLVPYSGRVMTTSTKCVRHMDDPYFLQKPMAKEADGAWDFTDWDKQQSAFFSGLQDRLTTIEDAIAALNEELRSAKSYKNRRIEQV